jgi:hypothetical protein
LSRTLALGQRTTHAGDPGVQRKIDALFADTWTLFRKHLRGDAIEQLRQELRSARGAAGGGVSG